MEVKRDVPRSGVTCVWIYNVVDNGSIRRENRGCRTAGRLRKFGKTLVRGSRLRLSSRARDPGLRGASDATF